MTIAFAPARPISALVSLDQTGRATATITSTTTTTTPAMPVTTTPAARTTAGTDTALDVRSDRPLHELVEIAQTAERTGVPALWLTGSDAPAVAARLLRLTRTLVIGVELHFPAHDGVAHAALDAVSLVRLGGDRVRVLVRDAALVPALAAELGLAPRPRATRFGGDAFTALADTGRTVADPTTDAGQLRVAIVAVVHHEGEITRALPFVSGLRLRSDSGVDAYRLLRRARTAVDAFPRIVLNLDVPDGVSRSAWPVGDGTVVVHQGRSAA